MAIVNLIHGQSQDTRLRVQAFHEDGVVAFLRQNLNIQIHVRFLFRNLSVVLGHCWLAKRYIDTRVDAPRTVLGVCSDDL